MKNINSLKEKLKDSKKFRYGSSALVFTAVFVVFVLLITLYPLSVSFFFISVNFCCEPVPFSISILISDASFLLTSGPVV